MIENHQIVQKLKSHFSIEKYLENDDDISKLKNPSETMDFEVIDTFGVLSLELESLHLPGSL
jgi:hypothetical protein